MLPGAPAILAAGMLSVALLSGQSAMPRITLINFPGLMELISGSSPEFRRLLTDFVGPDQVSVLQPVAPYLVTVKSNSTVPLRQLTVVWNALGADGQVTPMMIGSRSMKPGFRPGGMILMSPMKGLGGRLPSQSQQIGWSGAGGGSPSIPNGSTLSAEVGNFIRKWTSKVEVSISLDSVIFDDHTFMGPDHSGTVVEEISERHIEREMASELLIRAPSERSAYLKAVLDDPHAQAYDLRSEAGQRVRAAELLLGLTPRGDEDLLRRSMENIIHNDAHELHRKQPWTVPYLLNEPAPKSPNSLVQLSLVEVKRRLATHSALNLLARSELTDIEIGGAGRDRTAE